MCQTTYFDYNVSIYYKVTVQLFVTVKRMFVFIPGYDQVRLKLCGICDAKANITRRGKVARDFRPLVFFMNLGIDP